MSAQDPSLPSRMRENLLGTLGASRGLLSRASYPAAVAMLCAAACAPVAAAALGAGAIATAGIGVAGSLGSGVLTEVVVATVEKFRRRGDDDPERSPAQGESLESELRAGFESLLAQGSDDSTRAAEEASRLIAELDATRAALEAVGEAGNAQLQGLLIDLGESLAAGLTSIDGNVSEGFAGSEQRDEQIIAMLASNLQVLHRVGAEQQHEARLDRDARERLLRVLGLLETAGGATHGATPQAGTTDVAGTRRWTEEPYLGLTPFTEAESAIYFGREQVTAELVDRAAMRLRGSGILLVSGASGAGKSSVLRAGFLPAVRRGGLSVEGSGDWPCVVVQPGADPQTRLDDALRTHDTGDGLVLVVDQFEEIFTRSDADATRTQFVVRLAELALTGRTLVVLGVRGDFIERCADFPELREPIAEGAYLVPPMTPAEARQAITGPAAAAGLRLDDELADAVVTDLASGRQVAPTLLPLLSQTMRLLWERRDGERLTMSDYLAVGGVSKAIRTSADEAYQGLSEDERETARAMFRVLVSPTPEGLVRRTASAQELSASGPHRAAVLDVFVAKRLIVVGDADGTSAEISHDALLLHWPRLSSWMRDDLDGLLIRHQLVEDAGEWDRNGRDASYLYAGSRLEAVSVVRRSLWEAHPGRYPALTPVAEEFLDASRRRDQRRRRQVRTTAIAMSGLAALLAMAVAFVWSLNGNLTAQRNGLLAETLVEASNELRGTEGDRARLLAASAWELTGGEGETAKQALAAMAKSATDPSVRLLADQQATENLAIDFSADGKVLATLDHNGTMSLWDTQTWEPTHLGSVDSGGMIDAAIEVSPDGTKAVTATSEITVWDLRKEEVLTTLPDSSDVFDVEFSPDGSRIVTVDNPYTSGGERVRAWDVTGGPATTTLDVAGSAIAYGPDGRVLVGSPGGTVQTWDPATGKRSKPVDRHEAPNEADNHVTALYQVPGGTTVVCVTNSGCAVHRAGETTMISDEVEFSAISPDGARLLTKGEYGTRLTVWDLRTGEPVEQFDCGSVLCHVTAAAFQPGTSVIAAESPDGVILWDLDHSSEPAVLVPPPAASSPLLSASDVVVPAGDGPAAAFSPNAVWSIPTGLDRPGTGVGSGTMLAVSGDAVVTPTGTARGGREQIDVDGLPTGGHLATLSLPRGVVADMPQSKFRFSADGRRLAVAGGPGLDDDDAWVIGIETGRTVPVENGTQGIAALALSSDGASLATVDSAGTLRVWDARTGSLTQQVGTDDKGTYEVAFAGDASTVVTLSETGLVLWEVDTGARRVLTAEVREDESFGADTLDISQDGRFAVTIGAAQSWVWDLAQGVQVGTLDRFGFLSDAAFSPDGRTVLASASALGVFTVDMSHLSDLHSAVCSMTDRDLTDADLDGIVEDVDAAELSPCG